MSYINCKMLADLINVYNVLLVVFCPLSGYLVWLLFVAPLNMIETLDSKKQHGRNQFKKSMVNLAIQMRKIGDIPPSYPNSWYSILESDELPQGAVQEVAAFGQTLVTWRGKSNGQVYVSDPYCPHLGANLAEGGSVSGDCVQCPYHDWSFSGVSGKVAKVPYSNVHNHENLPGLKMWHVLEQNDQILVWYHDKGLEPTWHPDSVPEVDSGKWKYRGRSEFWATCHIQDIPENGADIHHFEALHELPAVPYGKFLLAKLFTHKWKGDWMANLNKGFEHESVLSIEHWLNVLNNRFNLCYLKLAGKQMGAGIVILHIESPIGHGVFIQCVTPVKPLLNRITHRFYTERKFIHPFAKLALYTEGLQISRDVAIWNRKCYLRNPVLVKEDARVKQYRKWFSQFYSEKGEKF